MRAAGNISRAAAKAALNTEVGLVDLRDMAKKPLREPSVSR